MHEFVMHIGLPSEPQQTMFIYVVIDVIVMYLHPKYGCCMHDAPTITHSETMASYSCVYHHNMFTFPTCCPYDQAILYDVMCQAALPLDHCCLYLHTTPCAAFWSWWVNVALDALLSQFGILCNASHSSATQHMVRNNMLYKCIAVTYLQSGIVTVGSRWFSNWNLPQ